MVNVDSNLYVSKGTDSGSKNSFSVSVDSKLGNLYQNALSIYNLERSNAFLENYSVDVLRIYAPVDGVDSSCSPKIWKTPDVVSGLKDALSANIAAIKFKG